MPCKKKLPKTRKGLNMKKMKLPNRNINMSFFKTNMSFVKSNKTCNGSFLENLTKSFVSSSGRKEMKKSQVLRNSPAMHLGCGQATHSVAPSLT